MHQTTLPRIPGRDYAGVVVEASAEWKDKRVLGSGDGLGFTRDGSHAEFLVVPENSLVELPFSLSFEQGASIGVTYLTAWSALQIGALQTGESILITGVTGSVGSAAAQIARSKGARVLGTVRTMPEVTDEKREIADVWIDLSTTTVDAGVLAAAERGVDMVFDVVGGPLFLPCLKSLGHRGRQVAIASTGDGQVTFNLRDFYHREARLFGLDSLALGFKDCRDILAAVVPSIVSGAFRVPEFEVVPFADTVAAYKNTKPRKKPVIQMRG
jgi:NADPH2:quinone reductase